MPESRTSETDSGGDDSGSSLDEDEEEEEPVYQGKRSCDGAPHGRGTLFWSKAGNRFEGRFLHGKKQGRGTLYFRDESSLSGTYVDDELEGVATYVYADGRYMEARYEKGDMNGRFTEYSPEGDVIVRGYHKDNARSGLLRLTDEFGGTLAGVVNGEGLLSGNNIVYVYPDHRMALVGTFEDGVMKAAKAATLASDMSDNVMPRFEYRTDYPATLEFDQSARDCISRNPSVPDHYEQDRVHVALSAIPGAGEGLFAKRDLDADTVASFYNGVRLSHEEVDGRDWSLNDNTISLDDEAVIDVPRSWSSVERYRASLGHKANHSSSPNCKYDHFVHPRFGPIKCVRTVRHVSAGEELTCDYGYHHKLPGSEIDDLPSWFKS